MKDDPFLSAANYLQPRTHQKGSLIPGAVLLSLMVADCFVVPLINITPLACAVMILWMALKHRPAIVAAWAVVFVCAVLALPLFEAHLPKGHDIPFWTAAVRSFFLVLSGVLACVISQIRDDLNRGYNQMITVLEKMPVPIVISDESGTINFINEQASELLGLPMSEAPGHSYFSFLANQFEKGKSIQQYLRIFDSDENQGIKLRIHLRRYPNKLMHGTLMGLGSGNARRLVTVIREGPEIRKGAVMPFMR